MDQDRAVEVLLVEDNDGDAFLTRRAFENSTVRCNIHHIRSGESVMGILGQSDKNQEIPKPDIVLLDMNLPGISGLEILKQIKEHPVFRRTPVIILTTSAQEADVIQGYDLRANSYIIKPSRLEDYHDIVKTIEEFWFDTVLLPRESL